ncbi:hypothetical protein YS110_15140 [Acidovorax sp. YS12]|mgnify:FL=1|nr:hypothetical protein [Comamonadaceae bacterium]UJB65994.1 hypothetical protein YS110_15140 [Acidovorax sp. YS12]
MENERCLHQLPQPLADTIAVLGSGLDLNWLAARCHLPGLHALLMDRATFDAHQHLAVAEPVQAPAPPPGLLLPEEAALDQHLRALERERLEQEFLPAAYTCRAFRAGLP